MIPSHLSYSTLNQWQCQKAFQLGKIVEAPPKPAVYFAGGSAVHAATEDHDRGDRVMGTWESYFYPEVSRGMEDHGGAHWDTKQWMMGGSLSDPETPESWMTIGPQCVSNWVKFTATEFSVTDIEVDVTTTLPGCPVPIKGFVDRTGVHVEHNDMIIDVKSGRNKPKDPLQLGVYHALMLHRNGWAPDKGAYFMAREGRIIGKPVDLTIYTPEMIGAMFGDIYAEMVEAERTGDYPANRRFECKFCVQQNNCLTYTGETKQAKHYDPNYREGKVSF